MQDNNEMKDRQEIVGGYNINKLKMHYLQQLLDIVILESVKKTFAFNMKK